MTHFAQHPMSDEELAKYQASLQNAAYSGDRMTWLNSAMQNSYVPPPERPKAPPRVHNWTRFSKWNPPRVSCSLAPVPQDRPPLWLPLIALVVAVAPLAGLVLWAWM